MRRRSRVRWWAALGLLAALGIALLAGANYQVEAEARGRVYADLNAVPARKAALVLGTSPTTSGRPNLYYTARLQAAAALYRAGKVQSLILSGDNSTPSYDEPGSMKRDLTSLGVPAGRLFVDDAGFRTLDSVVRAKKIFGQMSFVVVSQHFHNVRAVYLARRHGLDAVGYDAEDAISAGGLPLREWLARASAVLDVTVLHAQPKFLGDAVKLP